MGTKMKTQTATTRHWTSFGEHAHFTKHNPCSAAAFCPTPGPFAWDDQWTRAQAIYISSCTASDDGRVPSFSAVHSAAQGSSTPRLHGLHSRIMYGWASLPDGAFNLIKPSHCRKVTRGCFDLFRFGKLLLMNRLLIPVIWSVLTGSNNSSSERTDHAA